MAIKKIVEDVKENIALDNIDAVVNNNTPVDATVVLDPVTAAAYSDSVTAAEHRTEVEEELEEKAEDIIPEAVEEPKVKEDSIYTKKLKLDEGIEDFKLIDGSDDEEDRYTEFDMFDFIYSLFSSETDSLIRPLKALSNQRQGRGRKKAGATSSSFMYQGSDDYMDETGERGLQGVPQVSTDIDGNIVLYQDTTEAFDSVIALCNEYGFEYEGPNPKKAPWIRWNYSFKIVVPTYADGYPMDVEDYFEQQGIPMQEVMPANFIKQRNRDIRSDTNDAVIEVAFKKWTQLAARSNDPLQKFIKGMFDELAAQGVKYDTRKKELTDRFNEYFNDDFEDEE